MSVAVAVDQPEGPEKRPRKRRAVAGGSEQEPQAPPSRRGRPLGGTMTDEHKVALAEGREHGRAVRVYLEAIEKQKAPQRRGRRRTPESIEKRLSTIEEVIGSADVLTRLHLTQERVNLKEELVVLLTRRTDDGEDSETMTALEDAFVETASAYSHSKGITYSTWRTMGVPRQVLKRAGLNR